MILIKIGILNSILPAVLENYETFHKITRCDEKLEKCGVMP